VVSQGLGSMELIIYLVSGRNWSWPNLIYYPGNLPRGTEEIHEEISGYNCCPGRDLNRSPPEALSLELTAQSEVQI
jgi:hypothetical protein